MNFASIRLKLCKSRGDMKKNILIICQHNSGRSQIAEAYLRQFPGDHFEVEGSYEEKLPQVRRICDQIKECLMNPPEGTFSFQGIIEKQSVIGANSLGSLKPPHMS
jgi:hypothetical protein